MIKLGVSGACGKMGSRIIALASADKDFKVTLALERENCAVPNGSESRVSFDPGEISKCDVFIDFSQPAASMVNLGYVLKNKKALVLGTTGLDEAQAAQVKEAAKSIPIIFSPNMSVGVNTLFTVVADLAKKLGPAYGIEIVEAHHDQKKDAPSGTAKRFALGIKDACGKDVPTHSIRLGDIFGDHTIIFCGNSERIEIKHQAHSRDLFVVGALKAAKWLAGKPAGSYTMQDVLKSV
jgi:4-hydroxy-tetrahydrodipicolinate reductase